MYCVHGVLIVCFGRVKHTVILSPATTIALAELFVSTRLLVRSRVMAGSGRHSSAMGKSFEEFLDDSNDSLLLYFRPVHRK